MDATLLTMETVVVAIVVEERPFGRSKVEHEVQMDDLNHAGYLGHIRNFLVYLILEKYTKYL